MANWLGEDPPTRWLDPHARTMYREPSHAAPPPPSFNPADHLPPCGQVRTPNSFTGMSQHTADRTAKLQSLLQKTLGPDQVANRPGGGGTKLSYLEGWRAINLANEIFGYNGWYTDIKYLEADFIDYSPESQRWSIGVTAIVRVRLQDGASHEDVGYGKLENSKSKADALDKCKKEAVTDALKRALRHFGKLLGNCLYDKNYLEGLSKMKAPKPKFDFEGIYKPERDNVRPTASTSAVPPTPASTMPPPPPPAPRPAAAAASLPKKEPAKGPPPLPPHLAAQAHRASTVAPRTPAAAAAAAAPAPGARASSGPTPRRAATVAAPASVARAVATSAGPDAGVPNPYDRAGAQTEFPLNSDDESMFAAVELGMEEGEGEGVSEGAVEVESGTAQGCFEGDSGFGEVDGLGETSFLSAKPPFAAPPSMPTLVPHQQPEPQPQPQQRRPSPASTATSTSAHDSPKDPSDRPDLQAAKAAAQERLARKRREQANSPHPLAPAAAPAPHRRATVAVDAYGPSAGGGTVSASAAELLRLGQPPAQGPALALGTARPPALRPPQAPPSRSNSATSTGSGSGGAAGGAVAAAAGRAPAKVAGLLPALAVGAGVVRAATSGGAADAGGTNVASLGGVSGLVGVSPERLRSAAGGAAVEVPPQGGFVSARGVKRGLGEGYDPSPHLHSGASGPRASYSPRAPLGELDVDGVTGAVKRQKGSSG